MQSTAEGKENINEEQSKTHNANQSLRGFGEMGRFQCIQDSEKKTVELPFRD